MQSAMPLTSGSVGGPVLQELPQVYADEEDCLCGFGQLNVLQHPSTQAAAVTAGKLIHQNPTPSSCAQVEMFCARHTPALQAEATQALES